VTLSSLERRESDALEGVFGNGLQLSCRLADEAMGNRTRVRTLGENSANITEAYGVEP